MSTDRWIYPLGHALGSEQVSAAALVEDFGPVRDDFLDKTGFETLYRSSADETGLSLAERAISSSPVWWTADVDALIYVTSTGDLVAPGNSHLLQDHLAMRADSLLLDLNDACTGFVRAIHLADTLVGSGAAGAVLVVLSDTYSKLYDPSQLKVSPLFSDGASAVIVSGSALASAPPDAHVRRWSVLSTWFLSEGGRSAELSISRGVDSKPLGALEMNGGGVLNFVLKHLDAAIADLTTEAGVAISDVDRWYVHQGSRTVVSAAERKLGVEAGSLFRSATYGNTVGSSLPFQLIDDDPAERGASTIGMLAFGVGLTMAGMIVRQSDPSAA